MSYPPLYLLISQHAFSKCTKAYKDNTVFPDGLVLITIKQLHKPILIHAYIVDLSSIFCTPLLCTMTTVFSHNLTSLRLPVFKIARVSVQ